MPSEVSSEKSGALLPTFSAGDEIGLAADVGLLPDLPLLLLVALAVLAFVVLVFVEADLVPVALAVAGLLAADLDVDFDVAGFFCVDLPVLPDVIRELADLPVVVPVDLLVDLPVDLLVCLLVDLLVLLLVVDLDELDLLPVDVAFLAGDFEVVVLVEDLAGDFVDDFDVFEAVNLLVVPDLRFDCVDFEAGLLALEVDLAEDFVVVVCLLVDALADDFLADDVLAVGRAAGFLADADFDADFPAVAGRVAFEGWVDFLVLPVLAIVAFDLMPAILLPVALIDLAAVFVVDFEFLLVAMAEDPFTDKHGKNKA